MQDADEIVDSILSNIPISTDVEVNLPSENRIYKLIDESKPITIRPMTFEDEKSLINSADEGENSINILLSRCVSNININDLIQIDKFYLLMKLREISYGDDYKTLMICSHCNAENPITIKLSELNVNPVPDDFCEPIKYKLPILGKEVILRYPRVKDERFLENDGLDNIWRFIESIDGQTNKAVISKVIEKLPLVDVKTILKLIKTDFGIDTKIKMKCSECGEISIKELPINANFFDVSL